MQSDIEIASSGGSSRIVIGVWLGLTVVWATACWAALFGSGRPPILISGRIAAAVVLGFSIWVAVGFRVARVRDAARESAPSLLAGSALGIAVLSAVWSPPGWPLLWLGAMLIGAGAGIAALTRIRRHPMDSLIALIVFGLVVMVDLPWLHAVEDLGVELRVRAVSREYLNEAEGVLASGVAPASDRGVLLGVDDRGSPVVVAWIWARGFAVGSDFGVAYDPARRLRSHGQWASVVEFEPTGRSTYNCRHMFDDWFECSFS